MGLRLRPLRLADELEARAAHAELAAERFAFLLEGWSPASSWPAYLERLERQRRGLDREPGRVPATFLAAEADGKLVGRSSIRHDLNEHLLAVGGHIGYAVRPQHRGRGHAHEILRQSLVVARALGVDPVLVTCADDNLASRWIIERCGGVLEDVRLDVAGRATRRYWIV